MEDTRRPSIIISPEVGNGTPIDPIEPCKLPSGFELDVSIANGK
jgi:hypothetical protein